MVQYSKRDNTILATYQLIKKIGVAVTWMTLKRDLENHTDYPSFKAISDVLNSLKIENYIIEINIEELKEVPTPCLALLNIESGFFAVINHVKDDLVEWLHTDKGKQYESISTFSEKWKGIIMLVQANETSGELDFLKNKRKEILELTGQILFWVTGIIILWAIIYLSMAFLSTLPLFLLGIIGIKLIGIAISIVLLWYLLDRQNPFLIKICYISKSVDCTSVLNSKAATIKGILSWSEIGFFYFVGSFLALLMDLLSQSIITFLAFINLATLPYTLFSIYYQSIVTKKWCILCLSIQSLLWTEFGLFYLNNDFLLLIPPSGTRIK